MSDLPDQGWSFFNKFSTWGWFSIDYPCPASETENPTTEKSLDKVIFSTVIISEKRYNHHDHLVIPIDEACLVVN